MCIKLPRKKSNFISLSLLVIGLCSSLVWSVSLADIDRSVFWAIEKNQQTVGYLLGTIHSEDPRVLDFTEDFLNLLKNNQVFAMEMVPDLPTLARLTEYMHYPAGKTLESVIGTPKYQKLVTALSTYGVPDEFILRMKPWAAMMTLSAPPPETGFFMDLSLSLRAAGSGLKVIGLETLEEQLSFLEEMPLDMQLNLLDQAIEESGRVGEVHDQMIAAYLENDLQRLQDLSDEEIEATGQAERDYFFEKGIDDRNDRMLASMLPYLNSNGVFVAVGALHLPGERGLLNLLRLKGYQLTEQEMPFTME